MKISATAEQSQMAESAVWFATSNIITADQLTKVTQYADNRAWSIAKVNDLAVLADCLKTIEQGRKQGVLLEKTAKELEKKLAKYGVSGSQCKVIVHNATQHAYNAGRWLQLSDPYTRRVLRYLQYDGISDFRQTPLCRHLDGYTLPIDDPFIQTHYPPLHHRCRTTMRALTKSRYERVKDELKAVPSGPDTDALAGFGRVPVFGDQGDVDFGSPSIPDPGKSQKTRQQQQERRYRTQTRAELLIKKLRKLEALKTRKEQLLEQAKDRARLRKDKAEQRKQERKADERLKQTEQERRAKLAELERKREQLRARKAELERIKREQQAEQARIQREQQEATERIRREAAEQAKREQERLKREQAEQAKREQERIRSEAAERQRIAEEQAKREEEARLKREAEEKRRNEAAERERVSKELVDKALKNAKLAEKSAKPEKPTKPANMTVHQPEYWEAHYLSKHGDREIAKRMAYSRALLERALDEPLANMTTQIRELQLQDFSNFETTPEKSKARTLRERVTQLGVTDIDRWHEVNERAAKESKELFEDDNVDDSSPQWQRRANAFDKKEAERIHVRNLLGQAHLIQWVKDNDVSDFDIELDSDARELLPVLANQREVARRLRLPPSIGVAGWDYDKYSNLAGWCRYNASDNQKRNWRPIPQIKFHHGNWDMIDQYGTMSHEFSHSTQIEEDSILAERLFSKIPGATLVKYEGAGQAYYDRWEIGLPERIKYAAAGFTEETAGNYVHMRELDAVLAERMTSEYYHWLDGQSEATLQVLHFAIGCARFRKLKQVGIAKWARDQR